MDFDVDHFAPRPAAVREPLRSPAGLAGSLIAGAAMGVAELVPGFSGGTVALVSGIYERLIANVRQGARMLSLALRGHWSAAGRAFSAIEWLFVSALLIGMGTAIFTLASVFSRLIVDAPVQMSALFLGLVLGAAVVALGQLRSARWWHVAVILVSAVVTFFGLGFSPGVVVSPSLGVLFVGVALAACAWILPGVSGAFLLLLMGLYPSVLGAVEQRDVVAVAVFAAGALSGLALFSTLLNWLLARFHDLVLAAMIGLLAGSARVLWPWPSHEPMASPVLGAPEAATALAVTALSVGAFATVWLVGVVAVAVERRSSQSSDVGGDD